MGILIFHGILLSMKLSERGRAAFDGRWGTRWPEHEVAQAVPQLREGGVGHIGRALA